MTQPTNFLKHKDQRQVSHVIVKAMSGNFIGSTLNISGELYDGAFDLPSLSNFAHSLNLNDIISTMVGTRLDRVSGKPLGKDVYDVVSKRNEKYISIVNANINEALKRKIICDADLEYIRGNLNPYGKTLFVRLHGVSLDDQTKLMKELSQKPIKRLLSTGSKYLDEVTTNHRTDLTVTKLNKLFADNPYILRKVKERDGQLSLI